MITAAIVNDTRHIQLSVTSNGTPLTVERDGQQVDVTGIRFTYKEGAVTAIRIITTDGHLFAAEEDLDDPDSWVAWIRALADAHQPLPNRLELEALDSVMQGDTYSANGFILGI
ncbi:hypothetical protein, partial [Streptomyces sp. NPDC006551]|uniref:hypothetical protein n=1 Tax=Streptomyces sp. NPDC006551 TaxID=3157178 RepID=UPI0033ACAA2E